MQNYITVNTPPPKKNAIWEVECIIFHVGANLEISANLEIPQINSECFRLRALTQQLDITNKKTWLQCTSKVLLSFPDSCACCSPIIPLINRDTQCVNALFSYTLRSSGIDKRYWHAVFTSN